MGQKAAWSAGSTVSRQAARLGEVQPVDAGWEGMDVRMPTALGLVQTVAAREDHIGQPPPDPVPSWRRRSGANLKAASSSMQSYTTAAAPIRHVPRELQHHGRVVPSVMGRSMRRSAMRPSSRSHSVATDRGVIGRHALRQHAASPPSRRPCSYRSRLADAPAERGQGLLEHNDLLGPGEAGHQVLGPLKDELPTQVGEADQGVAAAMPEERSVR